MLSAKDRRDISSITVISEAPFEIITEILSWLPVESLLRFKCVCKQWRSLILDYKFIEKHMLRARRLQLSCQLEWELNNNNKGGFLRRYVENFNCVTCVAGLFLERSRTSTHVFRIRNFATHQVLYLPDAHNVMQIMGFVFDSSTSECKVAYCYKNEGDFGHEVGFKVLSIGKDDEWRTLKLPNKHQEWVLQRRNMIALIDEGVVHSMEIIRVGEDLKMEVVSLDIWSECFTVTTVPQRGFAGFADLHRVSILRWIQTIAVADIVGEALNVLVLQDLKEQKWSNITVPLKFLKDDPVLKDQIQPIVATTFDELQFNNAVRNNVFLYDMKREMIKVTLTKSTEKFITFCEPSLVTLKGMKKED